MRKQKCPECGKLFKKLGTHRKIHAKQVEENNKISCTNAAEAVFDPMQALSNANSRNDNLQTELSKFKYLNSMLNIQRVALRDAVASLLRVVNCDLERN